MNFTSFSFIFYFLPAVILLCLSLRNKLFLQNIFLCLASLIFYAWGEPQFIILLLVYAAANFVFGLAIDHFPAASQSAATSQSAAALRKLTLTGGIICNLGVLVHFKYADFFLHNFSKLFPSLSMPIVQTSSQMLPLGISFFTFHGISYLVDVYRGRNRALRDPATMLLYITFFPQLLAGPIIRYHEIARQFAERQITWEGASQGGIRFVVGLAKKVVIANQLAALTDTVYSLPSNQVSTILAWLAAISFTLQIYFDFSGYTDMACGLANIFGFTFPENFNYPYISQSVKEFWRRWHMSLSNFFRDYIYLPLGGNRVTRGREFANLFTVFLLCGLWHGANWTFICWGLYHGIFLSLERTRCARLLSRCPRLLRHCYTLLVVLIGFVLFRAADLHQALSMVTAMAGHATGPLFYPWQAIIDTKLVLLLLIAPLASTPIIRNLSNSEIHECEHAKNSPAQWRYGLHLMRFAGVFGLLYLSIGEMAASSVKPFLYFRF